MSITHGTKAVKLLLNLFQYNSPLGCQSAKPNQTTKKKSIPDTAIIKNTNCVPHCIRCASYRRPTGCSSGLAMLNGGQKATGGTHVWGKPGMPKPMPPLAQCCTGWPGGGVPCCSRGHTPLLAGLGEGPAEGLGDAAGKSKYYLFEIKMLENPLLARKSLLGSLQG